MLKRYGTVYDWHRRRHNGHVNVGAKVREKQRRNMTLRNGIFLFREAMGKLERCKHVCTVVVQFKIIKFEYFR